MPSTIVAAQPECTKVHELDGLGLDCSDQIWHGLQQHLVLA